MRVFKYASIFKSKANKNFFEPPRFHQTQYLFLITSHFAKTRSAASSKNTFRIGPGDPDASGNTSLPIPISPRAQATAVNLTFHPTSNSVQGALQLQRDFEYVTEFVCSNEASLCRGVVGAVTKLDAVKRAMRAVAVLQRTDGFGETAGKGGYAVNKGRGRCYPFVYTWGCASVVCVCVFAVLANICRRQVTKSYTFVYSPKQPSHRSTKHRFI